MKQPIIFVFNTQYGEIVEFSPKYNEYLLLNKDKLHDKRTKIGKGHFRMEVAFLNLATAARKIGFDIEELLN